MKRIVQICMVALFAYPFVSCSHYLDLKSDKSFAVPSKQADLQALLNRVSIMNALHPGLGEIGSDDFFLSDQTFNSLSREEYKESYLWATTPAYELYWSQPYSRILNVNTVIDHLDKVSFESMVEKESMFGQALYFRAITFHKLAQVFAVPFDPQTAGDNFGVVLRTSSDINIEKQRSSLLETYRQIENDLHRAVNLLPTGFEKYPTRPTKAAAYASLARFYLTARDYDKAGAYADSCLQLKSDLIDYNELPEDGPYPFDRFNKEIVFFSMLSGYGCLSENTARVDTVLYELYADDDLRKTRFFSEKPDGYFAFTGDYDQSSTVSKFDGITTAEMLLIRAESSIRANKVNDGIADLRTLLSNRMRNNDLSSIKFPISQNEAIKFLLLERRKELISRGQRWSDLRRLSFEDGLAQSMRRMVNGSAYKMSSEEIKRFAFYLPQIAIERGGLKQND